VVKEKKTSLPLPEKTAHISVEKTLAEMEHRRHNKKEEEQLPSLEKIGDR